MATSEACFCNAVTSKVQSLSRCRPNQHYPQPTIQTYQALRGHDAP
eukprot:CAMPEP_0172903236 /NCGR_PEP_ID=MMETSP1075-20121228/170115_1 /TAXON_ID=2916 /ORGANISM="Ceratium fusus, Strain PA161109" /LENGTH=45 /DNA_ID= /DNA_START= /DNA_END= /DNA_ORIENTATION=